MTETLQLSEINRAFLWIFILTGISLLYSAEVSAIDLGFDAPSEINLDEEFYVKVSYFENDTYDVKVIVQSLPDKKSVSEVYYEDKWTNSFYFIIGAFPKNKDFRTRVKTYTDSSEICVKLRRSSDKKGQVELCKPIKINNSIYENNSANNNQANDQDETNNQSDAGNDVIDNSDASEGEIIKIDNSGDKGSNYQNLVKDTEDIKNEKIFLGSDEIKKDQAFVTKEEKIRLGVVYSFAALCVLLIVLMSFNRL